MRELLLAVVGGLLLRPLPVVDESYVRTEAAHLLAYAVLSSEPAFQQPLEVKPDGPSYDATGEPTVRLSLAEGMISRAIDASVNNALAKANLSWGQLTEWKSKVDRLLGVFRSAAPEAAPATPDNATDTGAVRRRKKIRGVLVYRERTPEINRLVDVFERSQWTVGDDYAHLQLLPVTEYDRAADPYRIGRLPLPVVLYCDAQDNVVGRWKQPNLIATDKIGQEILAAGEADNRVKLIVVQATFPCRPCDRLADAIQWSTQLDEGRDVEFTTDAETWHVDRWPTTIITRGGREVKRIVGYQPEQFWIRELEAAKAERK